MPFADYTFSIHLKDPVRGLRRLTEDFRQVRQLSTRRLQIISVQSRRHSLQIRLFILQSCLISKVMSGLGKQWRVWRKTWTLLRFDMI